MYPNDAKVFLSASDLRTVTSSKNPTIHTRAHSLEIPGSDADEDFLMIDDIDLEDTADILNIILEDIGQPEFPNELQAPMNLAGNKNHDTTTTESSGDVRLGVPLMCKMNNPRRLKRVSTKQKIDTLREEIHELTYQLHRLEYAASVKKKNATKRDMNELFRARLWKLIAGRQLEQRLRSEKENSKLRLMMEMQIQEAKKLRYVLKRRKNIEV
ncbi:hypothetical protein PHMEG_0002427 [Phytophthora megakarya]|uniref:Uncharacterized protein n=1 Tax=Phytophthora megakarya TaxID=4795 RepID=A0A225X0N8_9STRA|nr:hypothetical protein PHMEG_0002427 [Phytophthora megakarya]